MDYIERFKDIFARHVKRDGADKLLEWLEKTDFYSAPASTKFHGACTSGLVMHSLNVYDVLRAKYFEQDDSEETFAIVALLHDLCKTNYYKIGSRNVKNEQTGVWDKVSVYNVEDAYPFGHGEKSVYLIERFLRLTPTEAIAIRWHMGGFDEAVRGGSYALSQAYGSYPLAVKLHLADLEATYLLEKGTSKVHNK